MKIRKLLRKDILLYGVLTLLATALIVSAFGPFEVPIQNQAKFNASENGPTVWFKDDVTIESGNPFSDANTVNLSSNIGTVNFSSTAKTKAQIDVANGTWTNISQIDATNQTLLIDPDDKNETVVHGDIEAVNFTNNMEPDDDVIDFKYDGTSGEGSVRVRGNFINNEQYGAVDADTNEALAVTTADSAGRVNFTFTDFSEHSVEVEELGSLFIREETPPYSLITSCIANIRFFETVDDNPTIAERSDSNQDGEINLTGLPVDTQFVVSTKCTGHNNRTVILPDISQQETVFLLNKSRNEDQIQFIVDDRTGLFGDRAQLIIQKAINRSEYSGDPPGFSWTNIGGDELGANSDFVIELENEDRYRIKIQNDQGDERILGAYTPKGDATETLIVGAVSWPELQGNATFFNASIENESVLGNEPPVILIQYRDPQSQTTNFNYSVFEVGNVSNEIDSGTASGTLGTFVAETNITENQSNQKWVVQIQYEHDGESELENRVVGGSSISIDADEDWLGLFALIGISLIGLLYGERTVNIGIVLMYATAGIAMIFQIITISPIWYIVSGVIVGGAILRGEFR